MCTAWKAYLDLREFPIEKLFMANNFKSLNSEADDILVARWVTSTRPALRSLEVISFEDGELMSAFAAVEPRTVGSAAWQLLAKTCTLFEGRQGHLCGLHFASTTCPYNS